MSVKDWIKWRHGDGEFLRLRNKDHVDENAESITTLGVLVSGELYGLVLSFEAAEPLDERIQSYMVMNYLTPEGGRSMVARLLVALYFCSTCFNNERCLDTHTLIQKSALTTYRLMEIMGKIEPARHRAVSAFSTNTFGKVNIFIKAQRTAATFTFRKELREMGKGNRSKDSSGSGNSTLTKETEETKNTPKKSNKRTRGILENTFNSSFEQGRSKNIKGEIQELSSGTIDSNIDMLEKEIDQLGPQEISKSADLSSEQEDLLLRENEVHNNEPVVADKDTTYSENNSEVDPLSDISNALGNCSFFNSTEIMVENSSDRTCLDSLGLDARAVAYMKKELMQDLERAALEGFHLKKVGNKVSLTSNERLGDAHTKTKTSQKADAGATNTCVETSRPTDGKNLFWHVRTFYTTRIYLLAQISDATCRTTCIVKKDSIARKRTALEMAQANLNTRLEEKREREKNFPVKMVIFSAKYHTDGDHLSQEETTTIISHVENVWSEYEAEGSLQGNVSFSSDGRVQAGCAILNCKDEFSGDWLKLVVNAAAREAHLVFDRSIKLKCEKIEDAKIHKMFMLSNTNLKEEWEDTCAVLARLGYEVSKWKLLHSKVDQSRLANQFTFMDMGTTHMRMDRFTRTRTHQSKAGATRILIKWQRGEDEPSKAQTTTLFTTYRPFFSFKSTVELHQLKRSEIISPPVASTFQPSRRDAPMMTTRCDPNELLPDSAECIRTNVRIINYGLESRKNLISIDHSIMNLNVLNCKLLGKLTFRWRNREIIKDSGLVNSSRQAFFAGNSGNSTGVLQSKSIDNTNCNSIKSRSKFPHLQSIITHLRSLLLSIYLIHRRGG